MSNEYFKKIKKLISDKAGVDIDEIHEASYFEDDLNIGEIELVEILTELEDIYDVELVADKEDLETVQDLIDLLVEHLE
jgi:acyl carrier protein